jgi:glycosyltransferase involved in cell wall biosynthesis
MKQALIISPYLDHLGGGERYMLTIASVLESLSYTVTYGWDNPDSINNIASLLGLDLKTPVCDPTFLKSYHSRNPLSLYLSTRRYDLVVYLSDGSIPLLGGKKNILHMQVPFHGVGGKNWKNQLKLKNIHHVVVNSRFTKSVVDVEYGINSTVLYPPVAPINNSIPKEDLILSVGRFEPSLNVKKQDILIEAFKRLSPQSPSWRLVLVGGSSNEAWVSSLQERALGYPIEVITNATHADLESLYCRAKIYWHAAGYGVDEAKNPELTEHFGISTVEAISAGAIPLVVGKGGQVEIVPDPQYHWDHIEDLVAKTISIISNPTAPQIDLTLFSLSQFKNQIEKIT